VVPRDFVKGGYENLFGRQPRSVIHHRYVQDIQGLALGAI